MRRLHLFPLLLLLACAPDESDELPDHRRDPFPEDHPEKCDGLPSDETYRCLEQRFWDVLRTDHVQRRDVFALMNEFAEHLDGADDPTAHARLHFQRGQLAMALALENDQMDLVFEVIPAFEASMELDPSNPIVPVWKDSMEIAFANVLQDQQGLQQAAMRAWDHVDDFPLGNVLSISGTTIGTPLSSGIPQETIRLLDTWECVDVPWCDDNTWAAPFAVPGLAYHFAEAYARVGDRDRAVDYLQQAQAAPDFEQWPYRAIVDDAAADVDGLLARFAEYGQDGSPFDVMYANQSYGCVFCHAPAP